MMRQLTVMLAAVATIACSKPQSETSGQPSANLGDTHAAAKDCGAGTGLTLSDSGIGAIRIGRLVDEVKASCDVRRDTVMAGPEAIPERFIDVALGGDSVSATIADNRVWRVEIDSPRFMTGDSLGVGTRMGRLLSLAGAAGLEGEGRLYVTVQGHCGLSFRISHIPGDADHRAKWTLADLRKVPADATVDRVLIVSCSGQ